MKIHKYYQANYNGQWYSKCHTVKWVEFKLRKTKWKDVTCKTCLKQLDK